MNQDENAWCNPNAASFMGGVHENNVLWYFAESPFYEQDSLNELIKGQMLGTEALATRLGYEAEMDKVAGKEFRVVDTHLKHGPDTFPNQGRWVIHHRLREKRDPPLRDQIQVLSVFYVIGMVVYKSPTIGDVLRSKMLDSMQKMESFVQRSSILSNFTAARGHQYIKQAAKDVDRSRAGSAIASRAGSPGLGQEDTVMEGSQESGDATKVATATSNPTIADSRALLDSFQVFARYGNEYMDDVELVGEPGNFSFKRNEPPRPQPASVNQSQTPQNTQQSQLQSQEPKEPKDTASPKVKIEPGVEADSTRDGTLASRPKQKRKKSKAPTSPTTPIVNARTPA